MPSSKTNECRVNIVAMMYYSIFLCGGICKDKQIKDIRILRYVHECVCKCHAFAQVII